MQYLFGLYSTCEFTLQQKSQIFNTEDYDDFMEQFKRSYLSGDPTFARKKLKVIPNNLFNVKGNYEVDSFIINKKNF
jgi:flagellum-specific peptidoglycan hydrolase FlgJ